MTTSAAQAPRSPTHSRLIAKRTRLNRDVIAMIGAREP